MEQKKLCYIPSFRHPQNINILKLDVVAPLMKNLPPTKMSGLYLLQFGRDGVLKILFTKDQCVSECINHKAVCRKAPATPGPSIKTRQGSLVNIRPSTD